MTSQAKQTRSEAKAARELQARVDVLKNSRELLADLMQYRSRQPKPKSR